MYLYVYAVKRAFKHKSATMLYISIGAMLIHNNTIIITAYTRGTSKHIFHLSVLM